jgi:hypothetical protein
MLSFELELVLFINLLLWAFILMVPPIVIRVNRIWYFKVRPSGMAFLNIILIKKDHFSEPILRHELEHVRQQRLFSPLGMSLLMLAHYGWLLIRYRSLGEVYKRSWLEKRANTAMAGVGKLPCILFIGRKEGE